MSEARIVGKPSMTGLPRQYSGMFMLAVLRITLIGCAAALIGTVGTIIYKAFA